MRCLAGVLAAAAALAFAVPAWGQNVRIRAAERGIREVSPLVDGVTWFSVRYEPTVAGAAPIDVDAYLGSTWRGRYRLYPGVSSPITLGRVARPGEHVGLFSGGVCIVGFPVQTRLYPRGDVSRTVAYGAGFDVSDATYLSTYLFLGGPTPAPMAAADVNNDGAVNISDVIFLLSWLFTGGRAPVADITADARVVDVNVAGDVPAVYATSVARRIDFHGHQCPPRQGEPNVWRIEIDGNPETVEYSYCDSAIEVSPGYYLFMVAKIGPDEKSGTEPTGGNSAFQLIYVCDEDRDQEVTEEQLGTTGKIIGQCMYPCGQNSSWVDSSGNIRWNSRDPKTGHQTQFIFNPRTCRIQIWQDTGGNGWGGPDDTKVFDGEPGDWDGWQRP